MKKYTEQDYINKCNELDVIFVGTHKDKHAGTIIEYICKKHYDKGVQFTDWAHFRNQKKSCKYCYGRNRTTQEAQSMVLNKNIEFTSEYKGAEKPIRCKCHKCGYEWTTNRPIDLFKRKCGCPNCAKQKRGDSKRKSQNQFIKDVSEINPSIEIIGLYKGSHKLIRCKCKIDGYEWESYACNLLNGSAGCPKCNMSIGENRVVDFMKEFNINYETQKTFSGCADVANLRFDVYDIDNNIAIEFQGEQHYFPVDFKHNNSNIALKQFEALKHRDNIKKEFCKNNNIKLICIPYWERENVKNYLLTNINEYKEKYIA